MCKECFDSVKEFFPSIPDKEVGNFLMSVTSFPFGSVEHVKQSLDNLREQTSSWEECFGIVEREMEAHSKLSEEDGVGV